MPSNQTQIIEQTKFTYSPLGKAFEKQIKTIEDQREKQTKAIQNQGQVKIIKKHFYDDRDSPLPLKQKEIFNKLVNKKNKEITKLNTEVSPNNLIYKYTGLTADAKFNESDNALGLIDKIREGETSLPNVKNDQKRLKSKLEGIKNVNNDYRSKEQKDVTYNVEMLYKGGKNVIKFYDDYSSIISEAKHEAIKGTGL